MSDDLNFDRPAYLGLDRDERWLDLIHEGLRLYGSHFAGSRASSYCPKVFDDLEAALQRWLSAPEVLTVSSGSLAAKLITDVLRQRGYRMLAGPLSHAAWQQPDVEAFATSEVWQQAARTAVRGKRPVVLVTDRLSPISCEEVDLDWVTKLGGDVLVIIDDSHGIGILDEEGRSSWARYASTFSNRLIVSASLGKAFSTPGAVVAGPQALVSELRSSSIYRGASPLSVAHAHTLSTGLAYALSRRKDLVDRMQRLRDFAKLTSHVAGFPVYVLPPELAGQLERMGIVVSRIRYPEAESEEVARLVVRAG